eukprot:scaffold1595_cov119-Isochrysis_galbana.AAC.3
MNENENECRRVPCRKARLRCGRGEVDPPTDDTEAREPDAPDPTDAKHHAPLHGPRPHRRRAFRQKKIFRRKRYTLAATRRNTSVPCRPDTSPPPSHSSPIPSPSSGRLFAGGWIQSCVHYNSLGKSIEWWWVVGGGWVGAGGQLGGGVVTVGETSLSSSVCAVAL